MCWKYRLLFMSWQCFNFNIYCFLYHSRNILLAQTHKDFHYMFSEHFIVGLSNLGHAMDFGYDRGRNSIPSHHFFLSSTTPRWSATQLLSFCQVSNYASVYCWSFYFAPPVSLFFPALIPHLKYYSIIINLDLITKSLHLACFLQNCPGHFGPLLFYLNLPTFSWKI